MDSPVSEIMSSPVKSVPPSLTVADVQLEMMRHGIHHLVLTEDGTPASPIVGVISEHDLLVVQATIPPFLYVKSVGAIQPNSFAPFGNGPRGCSANT